MNVNSANNDLGAATHAWSTHWPRIVAKAWADPAFHSRLLADPVGVATAEGLSIMPGLQIKIEAGATSPTLTLPLPSKPDELSTEDVVKVASSGLVSSGSCSQTCCC